MMKAAIFNGKGKIDIEERPDPQVQDPTDAVVRVVRSCVCGSDLWYYRGETPRKTGTPIGHEFIGVVEEVGDDVKTIVKGDLVIAPFKWSDGTCVYCKAGITTSCLHGGGWGTDTVDGCQGEMIRTPQADGTLVKVPGSDFTDEMLASLLTLSDVMCTGHHVAVSADVKPGDTVAVVGDGAVGLCAIIAAKRLGAERIIALSRNADRQKLAKEFGATDFVEERGEAAVKSVLELTDGVGVEAALECVGTDQSMQTAIGIVRPGGMVGYVGVPHGVELPIKKLFANNIGLRGGIAPARAYIPELLQDVLAGKINPGRVFNLETTLDDIKEAYAAMDERRAIKSLLRVSEL